MPISLKMPALSPTMEEGTLAKWLVKKGDKVEAGDIIAEIETDKATMEFETIDEGVVAALLVDEGSEGVKVGTEIAVLAADGEDVDDAATSKAAKAAEVDKAEKTPEKAEKAAPAPQEASKSDEGDKSEARAAPTALSGDRIKASPLARRIAKEQGVDLTKLSGSGPNGRIVKADVDGADSAGAKPASPDSTKAAAPAATVDMADETRALLDPAVPHDVIKLSGMRKVIAKRLTQSMQDAPHIYLTVDIRLDKLLEARKQLNEALASREIKLSVNDLLIKALGVALIDVPECNVAFAGNELIRYSRADVSVAVSIEGGLITPIVRDASGSSISAISQAMSDLGQRAKDGKLKPEEYQGGTASLSNMGMMGIKQFTAVINPPQATIIAVGAGEQRPIVEDGEIAIATMMTATGSFDHRAVDGADGARLMAAFKRHVENPLGMLA